MSVGATPGTDPWLIINFSDYPDKVTLGVTGCSGRRVRIGGRYQYLDVGFGQPLGAAVERVGLFVP